MTTYNDNYGNVFDLPPYTQALEDRIMAIRNCFDTRKRRADMYALCAEFLGAEYVKESTGADSVEGADVIALANVFNRIVNSYQCDMMRAEMAGTEEIMQRFDAVANSMDKAANAMNAVTASKKSRKR